MLETKKKKIENNDLKVVIIVSRYNKFITRKLLEGAKKTLLQNNVRDKNIEVVYVPGAWEIPVTAKKLSESKKFDVVINLGAVIKGQTPHFDYICKGVTYGLTKVALETDVPNTFGILTCNNIEEARERAGGSHGNKGSEAALAAIMMVNVLI